MVQYFTAQVVPALVTRSSVSLRPPCPFDGPPSGCSLSASLVFGTKDAPGSSWAGPSQALEPIIPSVSLGVRNQEAQVCIKFCHLMCSKVWGLLAGSQVLNPDCTQGAPEVSTTAWWVAPPGSVGLHTLYHISQSIYQIRYTFNRKCFLCTHLQILFIPTFTGI